MRIEKVKYDGNRVRIEYSVQRADSRYDEQVLSCHDEPRPEFKTALAVLAEDVCTICEIGLEQAERIKVSGVSLSYTNDVRGLVITALKRVKTAQSPVVLNTPHLTETPYSEGGDTPVLETLTVARLDALVSECERYIAGERAQQELPMVGTAVGDLQLAH